MPDYNNERSVLLVPVAFPVLAQGDAGADLLKNVGVTCRNFVDLICSTGISSAFSAPVSVWS